MSYLRTTAALLALTVFSTAAVANNSWWNDTFEQKAAHLSDIVKAPRAYQGIDVTFVVQFNSVGSLENPFYTKFEKEQFVNFSAWGDDARLWVRDEFRSDFPYLFIDRIKKEAQTILAAKTYDRFVVTGRVEAIFRGRPWIEVTGLKPLDAKMTEPSLVRLVKAYQLKNHRRFDAAAAEFQLAENKDLPSNVQNLLWREQGLCLAAAERFEDAVVPLKRALDGNPNDQELVRIMRHCEEQVILVRKRRENTREQDAPKENAGEPLIDGPARDAKN